MGDGGSHAPEIQEDHLPLPEQEDAATCRVGMDDSSSCCSNVDPSTTTTATTTTSSCTTTTQPVLSCGMYMAESAIPNSGLGMYTGQWLHDGEPIPCGSHDVVIQIEDVEENIELQRERTKQQTEEEDTHSVWVLHHYYWNPTVHFAMYDAHDVQSIVPGLGMLANSHTGLYNADHQPAHRVVVSKLSSSSSWRSLFPNAGAIPTYRDAHFLARGNITPGSEIYVAYGDDWFDDRFGEHVPLSTDFRDIDKRLRKLQQILFQSSSSSSQPPSNSVLEDVLQLTRNMIDRFASSPQRGRWLQAFPKDANAFESALASGTSATLTVPNHIRSIEWLQEHGQCLDHIRPGNTTLHFPGSSSTTDSNRTSWTMERGALASRFLPKGTVIAPLPLVHLQRSDLEIYSVVSTNDDDDNKKNKKRRKIEWEGTQLLLNYCYGHPNSSLLFFPYSPVVNYINHSTERVNAKLQWCKHPHLQPFHHSEWLERTPEYLLTQEDHAGLLLELVAIRDIEPDEEIFIDYGPAWERAWNTYVREEWEPADDPEYVAAAQLNDKTGSRYVPILPTKMERKTWSTRNNKMTNNNVPLLQNYPDNVFLGCYVSNVPEEDEDDKNKAEDNPNGKKSRKKNTRQRVTIPWERHEKGLWDSSEFVFPCYLESRSKNMTKSNENGTTSSNENDHDSYEYTVQLDPWDEATKVFIVEHVPRAAIRFFDEMYTVDDYLRNTFRHEIHLPDELVPEIWRDLQLTKKK